jgi:hypothetical protein
LTYSDSQIIRKGMAAKPTTTQERIGRVGQRQVVIPREMLETLNAKRLVDSDDTLTPAEAEVVRRGEAQLKRGQSKSWRAIKHALAR